MTFLVAGSASTGGLTALATRKFRHQAGAKTITGNSQKTRASQDKDGDRTTKMTKMDLLDQPERMS
jgi:hypothetical protein